MLHQLAQPREILLGPGELRPQPSDPGAEIALVAAMLREPTVPDHRQGGALLATDPAGELLLRRLPGLRPGQRERGTRLVPAGPRIDQGGQVLRDAGLVAQPFTLDPALRGMPHDHQVRRTTRQHVEVQAGVAAGTPPVHGPRQRSITHAWHDRPQHVRYGTKTTKVVSGAA